MASKPEIYLDMDGVCVDFMGAALSANGHDPVEKLQRWRDAHPGNLFPIELLDKPPEEFFTHTDLSTPEFWATLAPYAWFERLYDELGRLGHVVFLTAPTGSPGCVSGKHEWLNNRFGNDFHDFIFTRHKNRLAHTNAYLIDDMPFNIEPFNSRQGGGVLFPQIWNQHFEIDDPVDHVIDHLDRLINT